MSMTRTTDKDESLRLLIQHAEPRGSVEENVSGTTQHEYLVICVFNRTHLAQAVSTLYMCWPCKLLSDFSSTVMSDLEMPARIPSFRGCSYSELELPEIMPIHARSQTDSVDIMQQADDKLSPDFRHGSGAGLRSPPRRLAIQVQERGNTGKRLQGQYCPAASFTL